MKLYSLLILSFMFILSCTSSTTYKSIRLPASSNQTPKSCSDLLRNIVGLVPESAPANTLVISYQEGVYGSTLLEILENLDENTNIIIVITQNFDNLEILKTLKNRPNVTTIDYDTHGSVWARDWVPQKVIRENGDIEFVSLKYYAVQNSHESASRFAKALNLPHYESWLEGEMGNIMIDRKRRLFTTEKILEDNVSQRKKITKKMVIDELKKAFEAKEVHILPEHPRDGGIGHVDLTAKYLGNIAGKETVVVSSSTVSDTKKALDKTADIFKKLGFKVVRITEYEEKIGNGAVGFVNSLLFKNKVYMPVYSRGLEIKPQRLVELEKEARKAYESLGFKVIEIDSSSPIRGMGAVHCLTCTGNFEL